MKKQNLLEVKQLRIGFKQAGAIIPVVDSVSFTIKPGQTFALLGESGCGKSLTALGIMQLLPAGARYLQGSEINLDTDLLQLNELQLQRLRGTEIGMIFQEPMTSLNPVMSIGQQIAEVCNGDMSKALALLKDVGIASPEQRLHEYPHQLSGGMKQRIMIAMALAGEPRLLIADEPTTALDVTIQAQILQLLQKIQAKRDMAVLLITHDLGVVKQVADDVAVMYAGHIVETGHSDDLLTKPLHPYTQQLLAALPDLDKKQVQLKSLPGQVPKISEVKQCCRFASRCSMAWDICHAQKPKWFEQDSGQQVRCHLYDPRFIADERPEAVNTVKHFKKTPPNPTDILTLSQLKIHFPIQKGILKRTVGSVKAVDGVSLSLKQGQTLALVGESGCGKTTIGKGIISLLAITDGEITINKQPSLTMPSKQLHRTVQIIFQDPFSSMNPRMMVADIIAEGMKGLCKLSKSAMQKRVAQLLEAVGLPAESQHRYPHEFSGGQRQRICIARALAVEPDILILDEPTSALDVSVQAQILNLLKQLQHQFNLTYLFISHDISVVSYMADEVAVMYLGRIVEQADVQTLLTQAKHPYTQALLAAVPLVKERKVQAEIKGELPSPVSPPSGCHFHPRCPHVMAKCRQNYPPAYQDGSSQVKCFLYENAPVAVSI